MEHLNKISNMHHKRWKLLIWEFWSVKQQEAIRLLELSLEHVRGLRWIENLKYFVMSNDAILKSMRFQRLRRVCGNSIWDTPLCHVYLFLQLIWHHHKWVQLQNLSLLILQELVQIPWRRYIDSYINQMIGQLFNTHKLIHLEQVEVKRWTKFMLGKIHKVYTFNSAGWTSDFMGYKTHWVTKS